MSVVVIYYKWCESPCSLCIRKSKKLALFNLHYTTYCWLRVWYGWQRYHWFSCMSFMTKKREEQRKWEEREREVKKEDGPRAPFINVFLNPEIGVDFVSPFLESWKRGTPCQISGPSRVMWKESKTTVTQCCYRSCACLFNKSSKYLVIQLLSTKRNQSLHIYIPVGWRADRVLHTLFPWLLFPQCIRNEFVVCQH